eukprot:4763130-Amphidinium_carterae.1
MPGLPDGQATAAFSCRLAELQHIQSAGATGHTLPSFEAKLETPFDCWFSIPLEPPNSFG